MIRALSDWESGLEERVRHVFGEDGLLSRGKGFEYRRGQQEMAGGIARVLEQQQHLMVEAGTGVGKSLAYLIPSLYFATEQNRKAVVSTYTISLQEQLFEKDIPMVKAMMPFEFDAVLLKGRQNYVCPRRLEKAMKMGGELFGSSEQAELQRIWEWFQRTEDGTLSDFEVQPDAKVWSQVCSEPHICTSRTCGEHGRCFYQRARKRVMGANLVIMNHHLFFTYLGGIDDESSSREGFIFPNDFVIFDEAHCLEATASKHIGLSVSSGQFKWVLQRLYQPKTRKGLLPAVRSPKAEEYVVDLMDEVEAFFGRVETACSFKEGNECRVRESELVDDTLSLPLLRLRDVLGDVAAGVEDTDAKAELQDAARRLVELRKGVVHFLEQGMEDYVYWVERRGYGHGSHVQLQAAPIALADVLRQVLFKPEHTAVMTSATLSAGRGLEYFQKRVGGEVSECLEVESPFFYEEQMRVYIPRHVPEPREREKYEAAMCNWIGYFVEKTGGKAFVLFTSYGTLSRVADRMREWFRKREITLLEQGGGQSRRNLVAQFKEDVDSVLFGTDSFWQGVDIPGEALSNVIVTRLPFSVPDHPLVQSRMERIEEMGGDAFRDFSLPEAVLKFRQGVGRLIRTQRDDGIVAILDSRILGKVYGRVFMAKLPKCPVEILDGDEPPLESV